MKIKNWEAFHWDCLEIMKSIPDGSIDAIITDPPYWSTACKWDSVIPFEPMWKELKRIIKPNGAIVLFWSEPFSSALRMSNIKMYKYDLIYCKTKWSNPMLAKKMPMQAHENICIFYNKLPSYNPQYRDGYKYKWRKTWWRTNNIIWLKNDLFCQNDSDWKFYPLSYMIYWRDYRNQDRLHPTQKPVALIEYLIKTYTNEWETVLDFTAWSFTTAIACENTNRKWIWIEQDEDYFNIGIERINNN